MKQIGQHAVVIGASMGGLLAARALSDFYAIVTVLERDKFPHSDVPRKGVPRVTKVRPNRNRKGGALPLPHLRGLCRSRPE